MTSGVIHFDDGGDRRGHRVGSYLNRRELPSFGRCGKRGSARRYGRRSDARTDWRTRASQGGCSGWNQTMAAEMTASPYTTVANVGPALWERDSSMDGPPLDSAVYRGSGAGLAGARAAVAEAERDAGGESHAGAPTALGTAGPDHCRARLA